MNILFFINNDGHGVGGHYHSLDQISKEVGKGHKVGIVTMGLHPSPILSENPFFLKHIHLSGKIKKMFSLNRELKGVIKNFKPDLLHCFDTASLNRLLILPATFSFPLVLNKCGGPNPFGNNYQHANALVVFSAENHQWFENNPNYKKENVFLIANRVEKLKLLPEEQRKEKKDTNKITFLRITRIGGAYEKTLLDSFRMIEDLKDDHPVQLIVVGKVQKQERFAFFKQEAEKRRLPVQFITDERASKASDFLYLADFVIGTGRSFMEALSLGFPVLTPAKNTDWPVLVNERNFKFFFSTNFSERNIADPVSIKENKGDIEQLIANKKAYLNKQKKSIALFEEYLGTKFVLDKYNIVYENMSNIPVKKASLILKNLPYIVKFYMR